MIKLTTGTLDFKVQRMFNHHEKNKGYPLDMVISDGGRKYRITGKIMCNPGFEDLMSDFMPDAYGGQVSFKVRDFRTVESDEDVTLVIDVCNHHIIGATLINKHSLFMNVMRLTISYGVGFNNYESAATYLMQTRMENS